MALKYYSREWCDEAQRRLNPDRQHVDGLNSLKRVCQEITTEE
jgi:hypothetical protein